MDFAQKVPFGKTGVLVSRMAVASGYGAPASAIERAFHEHGVNYFYVSPLLNLGAMVQAIRNIAPGHRDDLFIVLAKPFLGGLGAFRLEAFVDKWLRKLGLERAELVFQDVGKAMSAELLARVARLKEAGKLRFVGVSSHQRTIFPKIAAGEVAAPSDFFQVRYNAVHTGAERDIFPQLPAAGRPGIVIYTATCWRKPLKAKNVPPGERPLTAAECYRFVLSNPSVDVCITAPKNAAQMEENLKVLAAGPLDEQEMARVRRIGKHVYGK